MLRSVDDKGFGRIISLSHAYVTLREGQRIKWYCSQRDEAGDPRKRNYNLQEDAIIHETSLQSTRDNAADHKTALQATKRRSNLPLYQLPVFPGHARVGWAFISLIFSCLPAFRAPRLLVDVVSNVKRRDLYLDNVFGRVAS